MLLSRAVVSPEGSSGDEALPPSFQVDPRGCWRDSVTQAVGLRAQVPHCYWLEASFHAFPHGPLLGQLITRQLTPLSMNRRRTSHELVPKSEAAGFL